MTLTLALVRHGKSGHPAMMADHDRPLAERGLRDAPRIGAWLARQGVDPDRALVSTARRTVETWEGLQAGGLSAETTLIDALYHARPLTISHVIAERRERSLIVVGHNGGIGEIAAALARAAPPHGRFYDYPTCATTILDFEVEDWAQAMRGKGEVRAFAVPADLD